MTHWITFPNLSTYTKTIQIMEDKVSQIINKSSEETVYLVEYNDVYTAGTSSKLEELLDSTQIPVIYTDRGGKFTYHGPGQRVIYPIIDLSKSPRKEDLKLYIKNLEQWITNTLLYFGIKSHTVNDRIGVWTHINGTEAKIAAIGVRIKKWVTYHGIAVNISTDLDKFSGIIPCGIRNYPVTSLLELGVNIQMNEFDQVLKSEFKRVF